MKEYSVPFRSVAMEKDINNEKHDSANLIDIFSDENYRNFVQKMRDSGNEQMFAPVYSGIPTFH